jgi:hypothetical protein
VLQLLGAAHSAACHLSDTNTTCPGNAPFFGTHTEPDTAATG